MAYTALDQAKDKAGKTIGVGSVCVYLGGDEDDRGKGDRVIVRAIAAARDMVHAKGKLKGQPVRPFEIVHLRVDNAIDKPDEAKEWGWSAWVCEDQIVSLGGAA